MSQIRWISVPKIKCPKCESYLSKVMDTRPSQQGVYRRRRCGECGHRYNTEETYRPYSTKAKPARQHKM